MPCSSPGPHRPRLLSRPPRPRAASLNPTAPGLREASGNRGNSLQERNKALARAFYQDLWFSQNTDRYSLYFADEYVLHDIGDDKGITLPAGAQKEIADFFHANGRMSGAIDYQIAEGDLVATRWQWKFQPTSLLFRILGGREQIPIINVMRFEDGKVVELWNHRHDIDTARANIRFFKGLGLGLILGLPGWALALVTGRRSRNRAGEDQAGSADATPPTAPS